MARGNRRSGLAITAGILLLAGAVPAQAWTYQTAGSGDDGSCPGGIVLAADGSVIAAGAVDNLAEASPVLGHDMLLAKLDQSGSEIWRTTIDGLLGGNDGVNAVDVDAAGDVFGAGFLTEASSNLGVVKVAGINGAELWRTTLDSPGQDSATDVAADANGDVIAVGYFWPPASDRVLVVVKLRGSDGAVIWQREIPGYHYGWVIAGAVVAIDANGDVLVGSGTTETGENYAPQFTILKLAGPDGTDLWRYDRPALHSCEVRDIAVNANGDVAATGTCATHTYGITAVKVDGATGTELWAHHLFGSGVPNEGLGMGVAFDSAGDVVVSGDSTVDFERLRFHVFKFDGATGAHEWDTALLRSGDQSIAWDVAVDGQDDVIAVGTLDSGEPGVHGFADFAVAKFSGADGTSLWTQEIGGYPEPGGRAWRLALDGSGDAYVIGSLQGINAPGSTLSVVKVDGQAGGPVRLPGTALRMRDNAADPSRSKLTVTAHFRGVAAPLPGVSDPRNTGAVLKISNPATGESSSIPLPAGGWSDIGTPASNRGFLYKDGGGPCRLVRVRKGSSLKAVCRGADLGFTLDEATQGTLQVEIIMGSLRQCMRFGGVVVDQPGRFSAKRALRPAECP